MLNVKYEIANDNTPVIDIENNSKKYWSLTNLLNEIDNQELSELLKKIENVETEKTKCEEFGSQGNIVEIENNVCKISDLFEYNADVTISLSQLKKIVADWKVEREKLLQQINNA